MIRKLSYLVFLVFAFGIVPFLFPRCANIVPPTGGDRDTIPPVMVRSIPDNYSTNFAGTSIEIEFDEFIQIRNINQQFIITPPQRERPQFRVRGRRLLIDLNTTPIPNTTYTLNFGEAIADLNEGNRLTDFEFVFSTGDKIDSLTYEGVVFDAYTRKPVENVVVMLYEELNDSVPFRRLPLYVNRTNKEGRFKLNNLRSDTFLLFALADANNNYLYDQRGEEAIAFSHDYVVISAPNDTIYNIIQSDTLYLFKELTGRQYLTRTERSERGKLLFKFNLPLEREWNIEPVSFTPTENWAITEITPNKDSVLIWITDQEIRETDNMRFAVSYWRTGPSDSLTQVVDTVNLNFQLRTAATRRQATENETEPPLIPEFSARNNGTVELNRRFSLKFPAPLETLKSELISFGYVANDSFVEKSFELKADSVTIRTYKLIADLEPGTSYRFNVLPEAFTDIFNNSNDSLSVNFTTRNADYYGTIVVDLKEVNTQMIIQLLDERDNIVQEKFANSDGELFFTYLIPANYKLKAIYDVNENRKWDTGNYMQKIEPEKVIFYHEAIAARSNWDIEIVWQIN